MQRPSPARRQAILKAAGALFSSRPYHEVHLDDIAARARVGKGTLYIYFKDKHDIYASVLLSGYEAVLAQLQGELDQSRPPLKTLAAVVGVVARFALAYPGTFDLMRAGLLPRQLKPLIQRRRQLGKVVESALRRAADSGEIADDHPEWTAQYIVASIRGIALHGMDGFSMAGIDELVNHLLKVMLKGIRRKPR